MANAYRKVASFKDVEEFSAYLKAEKIPLSLVEKLPAPGEMALGKSWEWKGRKIGNHFAILPMEGWDCERDGNPSELTRRRWLRFAASGAKLLCGTEAASVLHEGRSNPFQLMIADHTVEKLGTLLKEMRKTHRDLYGTDEDLQIGLQLTHSGRFAHPDKSDVRAPRTAYAHPLLDKKFGCGPEHVVSDKDVKMIIDAFIHAAVLAQKAGFDFVDVKQAHGYLGHEFLTAYDRPGPYGGSFENRTRFFREIVEGIRKAAPGLEIVPRLSIFDILPFMKGSDGVGHPMEWEGEYPYAFGGDGSGMNMDPDLKETVQFVEMMHSYGIDMVCGTIGSPYYNVHMQRPAYFAVCDGYAMPEDPVYNIYRHFYAVKRLKELCPYLKVVGAGATCLQEFLPHVAEYAVAHGEMDSVGLGRMVLSYPHFAADVLAGKELEKKLICRTFGECTNGPRNGMVSGCYILDSFYKATPEAERLKELRKKS